MTHTLKASPEEREYILRLAHEASPDMTWYEAPEESGELDFLIRFAELVREPMIEEIERLNKAVKHWRDECSDVCNENQALINRIYELKAGL